MSVRGIFRLALRNIWRHPRRTLLTALAIAFAAAVLEFFISIQLKSYDSAINISVGLYHGHMQVQREGYLNKPELRKVIENWRKLASRVKLSPQVIAVSPRGQGFALISSAERSYGAQIVGVDVLEEGKVSAIPSRIVEGRYLGSPEAQEGVLGASLARNLKVHSGDEVTLLGQGYDGSLAAAVLKVAGIFESGSADLDRGMLQIPLAVFQEVFSLGDKIHTLVIKSRNLDDLPLLEQDLRHSLAAYAHNLAVHSWEKLLPGLRQSIELDMAVGWLFYFSLIIIVTFGIVNTMLMSVLERTKEFGVMLAVGTQPLGVALLVMLESAMLTALGIGTGICAGSAVVAHYHRHGFSVPGTEEILKQWNLPGVIFPDLSAAVVLVAPSVITAVTLLAALYPAYKAFRLAPLAGIRGH